MGAASYGSEKKVRLARAETTPLDAGGGAAASVADGWDEAAGSGLLWRTRCHRPCTAAGDDGGGGAVDLRQVEARLDGVAAAGARIVRALASDGDGSAGWGQRRVAILPCLGS
ncbi:hypothetical protein ACLOJK_023354 [Asimina triloba]